MKTHDLTDREDIMRIKLRVAGDTSLPRTKRDQAWREYQRLHQQRTPAEVERMERKRGLR